MENAKHKQLKNHLTGLFRKWGYRIDAADGISLKQPQLVKNERKVGDGQDKMPDIDAVGPDGRIIRGEVKTGEGDIATEHSITQYQLFASLEKNGLSSWLVILVPAKFEQELNHVLDASISKQFRKNIFIRTT